MITIKNKSVIQKMQRAGFLLSGIFERLESFICSGLSTGQVDEWFEAQLAECNLVSKCKGYMGYKHVSCISINDEVVHGIPSKKRLIAPGDLVTVDVCASWNGYCADMARCYIIEPAEDKAVKDFLAVAYSSLNKGIAQALPGNHLSDISAAIQQEVERHGYGVVRDFAGHGIGKSMHEDPEVLNYGKPGKGPILRPGMALAIEPMITMKKYDVCIMEDGWTVKTVDKSLAAHVEDTIIITSHGPQIITRR